MKAKSAEIPPLLLSIISLSVLMTGGSTAKAVTGTCENRIEQYALAITGTRPTSTFQSFAQDNRRTYIFHYPSGRLEISWLDCGARSGHADHIDYEWVDRFQELKITMPVGDIRSIRLAEEKWNGAFYAFLYAIDTRGRSLSLRLDSPPLDVVVDFGTGEPQLAIGYRYGAEASQLIRDGSRGPYLARP